VSLLAWCGLALAGGVGASLRYLVELEVSVRRPDELPLATLVVNLTGAALLGLLAGLGAGGTTLFVLGTGLLGAYTTFSGWMREVGESTRAVQLVVAPLVLGLLAVWLGRVIGQAL
jgi:fluoride exporter